MAPRTLLVDEVLHQLPEDGVHHVLWRGAHLRMEKEGGARRRWFSLVVRGGCNSKARAAESIQYIATPRTDLFRKEVTQLAAVLPHGLAGLLAPVLHFVQDDVAHIEQALYLHICACTWMVAYT